MCEHSAANRLKIGTEVFGLDDVAEAWRLQAGSPGHKLAVRLA
jgi:hypothetical protein